MLRQFINKCNYNLDSKYYINTSDYKSDESIRALAQETKNLSIRELEMLIENATEIAKDEYLSTQEETLPQKQTPSQEQVNIKIINLTKEHMSQALDEIKPQIIAAEKTWTKATGIWIKNFGKKQDQNLLLTVIGSAFVAGFGWVLNIWQRNYKEKQQQELQDEQKRQEEKREQEQREREKRWHEREEKWREEQKQQLEKQNSLGNQAKNAATYTATSIATIATIKKVTEFCSPGVNFLKKKLEEQVVPLAKNLLKIN